MPKQWLRTLQKLVREPVAFDPSRFEDPLAARTAWTPLKRGGASFCTRKLVRIKNYRIEFHAAPQAVLFYSLFLAGGLAAMLGITYVNFTDGALGLNANTIIPIGLGAVFAAAGGAMLYFGTIPAVFDKMRGCFWRGRSAPAGARGADMAGTYTEFSRIHALQIIAELCRGKNSSYYSYELNLVLDDGRRINVADHGNLKKIRADAVALAEFLGKPLWDAAG